MTGEPAAAEVLACCTAIYSHPLARILLGDFLHPGGAALSRCLLELLGVRAGSRVLDVAAGTGATALLAARQHGCHVIAIEQSAELVAAAQAAVEAAGLAGQVEVLRGDAEALPVGSASADAVLCECALCTFARPEVAVAELVRVLRPGGLAGITDVTRRGELPASLSGAVARAACLAGALPPEGYRALLEAGGLAVVGEEDHRAAAAALAVSVHDKLAAAELLERLGHLRLPDGTVGRAREVLRDVRAAIADGRLGYGLWVAEKPAGPGAGRQAASTASIAGRSAGVRL